MFAAAGGVAAGSAKAADRVEALRNQLLLITMRKERWERVIATQQILARDPNRLSQAAADTARDLKASGRELVVEGVSLGLSSALKLQAYYARRHPQTEQGFKEAAARIDFAYEVFVKDQVKAPKPGDPKPEELVAKVNATIGLGVERIPDPKVKSMVEAMMGLSKGTAGFLSAYMRDDKREIDARLADVQSLLEGMLAMMSTISKTKYPATLSGRAAAIAQKYPTFGAAARFMATTAVVDFQLAIAISNMGWGTYALWAGYDLDNQAEAIRDQQQRAAVILQRLLPRARQEVARAKAEMTHLQAQLDALEPQRKPALTVLPSQRFIDDDVAVPLRFSNLPFTLDVIRQLPPVRSGITEEELRLRERAAKEAERRRREAARAAEGEALRRERYSEERDDSLRRTQDLEPARSSPPPSDDSNSCWKRHCLGGDPRGTANRIIDELNQQQRGSALGPIQQVK